MTVTTIWAGRSLSVKVNDKSYNFKDYFNNDRHIELFKQALVLNTSGTVKEASATELSMIVMMDKLGVNLDEMRKDHLPSEFIRFHFTSKRKRMSTVIENMKPFDKQEFNLNQRIHLKGASEIVLASCKYYLN